QKKYDDTRMPTRATPATQSANGKSSSSILSLEEAIKHPLWPDFQAYCESEGGSATLKGFNTWLPKQVQRNGAPKHARSRSMPIAHRNKIINRLNEEKARIIGTFPDGRYAQWAEERLANIQSQLQIL